MNTKPHLSPYLGEHLCFEKFIADLSRKFIDLDGKQLNPVIEEAQKLVCEAMGFDCSAIALWDGDGKSFLVTHSWNSPGFESACAFESQKLPWLASKILRGDEVRFTSSSEFSLVSSTNGEIIEPLAPKSSIILPLKAGGQVFGGLAFGTLRVEREWPEQTTDRLRLIANAFSNALALQRSAEALLTSQKDKEQLFCTVANMAPVLIWMSGKDKLCTFCNDCWLAFTDHRMEEELCRKRSSAIHPDDLNPCLEVYSTAFDARAEFELEYRLRRFDGEYRWVFEHGVPLFEPNGTLRGYVGSCFDITERKQSEKALNDAIEHLAEANRQIENLKEKSKRENNYLHQDIKVEQCHQEVVGQSQAIRRVLMKAEQVAPTNSTVLLLGETGTGKELIARAIHRYSKRRDRMMVNVNCAALPATLVENELFGREKGAYTGALTREIGRFELAHESTIFLDEIGELPLELQAKLLRVLQEGEFERLGSSRTIRVDARLIVATSRNLEAAVREGKFREDLYYRLNVFPIHIPPLRERREDIPMLTWHFLRDLGGRMGRKIESVRASTMNSFESYSWPGNVRELRNVIERHLIIYNGPAFEAELPPMIRPVASAADTAAEVERNHIHCVLERTGWRIRGHGGAAETLDLKPTTLESRMRRLGIFRQ